MRQFEYSVLVPSSPPVVFRAFCHLDRLLKRGIYTEVNWIQGDPWQVGSRVRYTLQKPTSASITALVTAVDAPRSVSLLNHGLGITAEQHVTFRAIHPDSTKILMIVTAVGTSREISNADVESAIEFLTRDALDTIAPASEKLLTATVPDDAGF